MEKTKGSPKQINELDIVIPVYGENEPINEVLKQIPVEKLKRIVKNKIKIIIVYSPSSNDKTLEIDYSEKKPFVEVKIIVEKRRGYGRAYLTGFQEVTGDVVVTFDADGTYPVKKLSELLIVFLRKNLDFLNINRLKYYHPRAFTKLNLVGNKILTFLTNILFFTRIRDSQSGMWIFRANLIHLLDLKSRGMEFSTEIKIEAFKKGKFGEIATDYYPRIDGSVPVLNPLKDGFRIFIFLLTRRFRLDLR